jgi:hypothetical protein
MPVTRRAPYTAIGLWTGGYDNPHRRKPDQFVGAGDMKNTLDPDAYKEMHRETRAAIDAVRSLPNEDGITTGVSFTLPTWTRKLWLGAQTADA